MLGKIPEEVCVNLLEKYQTEQKQLAEEVEEGKSVKCDHRRVKPLGQARILY